MDLTRPLRLDCEGEDGGGFGFSGCGGGLGGSVSLGNHCGGTALKKTWSTVGSELGVVTQGPFMPLSGPMSAWTPSSTAFACSRVRDARLETGSLKAYKSCGRSHW